MNRLNGYEKYKYDGYTVFGTITSDEPVEHTVEDARTRTCDTGTRSDDSERKKRVKNKTIKNKRGFVLIACITLLCFCLSAVAADLFCGTPFSTYASLLFGSNKKSDYRSYYLVYATHSEDMGISYKNATVIRKEGGAGYVLKNGQDYYVILNAYEKETDANTIAKRQGSYGVFELKLYYFDLEKSKDLKETTTNENLYVEIVGTLYETAVSLQANIFTTQDVKVTLSSLKEKIVVAEETFEKTARNDGSNIVLDYKVLLRTMKSAIENLLNAEGDLISLLRYYEVSILHSQALFRDKYFKKN